MEDLSEKRKELRAALKEKYSNVLAEMYKENDTYTEDDLLDKLLTACHGGADGVKSVEIRDGIPFLIYGEGAEVNYLELKAEWNEIKEISDKLNPFN